MSRLICYKAWKFDCIKEKRSANLPKYLQVITFKSNFLESIAQLIKRTTKTKFHESKQYLLLKRFIVYDLVSSYSRGIKNMQRSAGAVKHFYAFYARELFILGLNPVKTRKIVNLRTSLTIY